MRIRRFNESLIDSEPRVGDYVLLDPKSRFSLINSSFTKNTVCRIVKYNKNAYRPYVIRFYNIPSEMKKDFQFCCRSYKREDILDWSKNKEYLEFKLMANKFNV